MYDPYGDRQWRRAQRRYQRYQNPMRGLAGGLMILALIIAFAVNNVLGGTSFLVILFIGLAFASFFGSFSTMHRYGVYGGLHGFIWFLGLALCFIIGFWPWILLPVAVTMILGALYRPIMGGLAGAGFLAAMQMQQPPYPQQQGQPPYPQQAPYPPQQQAPYPQQGQPGYQQGYQGNPAQPHEAHQEGSQPQSYYPGQQQQELPPMEQQ